MFTPGRWGQNQTFGWTIALIFDNVVKPKCTSPFSSYRSHLLPFSSDFWFFHHSLDLSSPPPEQHSATGGQKEAGTGEEPLRRPTDSGEVKTQFPK